MLILDTHIWIWLLSGEKRLEKIGFLPQIKKAAIKSEVSISAITLWEAAMLIQRGRITISENTGEWFDEALSAPGISIIPLSADVAVESTTLPGNFHGDPADQIIVATARLHEATLATVDQKILDYGSSGFLKVLSKPKR